MTEVYLGNAPTYISDYAMQQFAFLYKVQNDESWHKYEPTTNDIQIRDGIVEITANDFKSIENFANVIEVKLPSKWINGNKAIDVTYIAQRAFQNCRNLISVDVPKHLTNIDRQAFMNCSSLTTIIMHNSITHIGYDAFWGCNGLTSVTIPDSVTSIGNHAFQGCSSLTSMSIPDSVTSIGEYAFQNCNNLVNVTIPDSVTNIGIGAFNNCVNIKTAFFENRTLDQIKAIYDAFSGEKQYPWGLNESIIVPGIQSQPLAQTSDGKCKVMSFKDGDSATNFTYGHDWTLEGSGLWGGHEVPTGEWMFGDIRANVDGTPVIFGIDESDISEDGTWVRVQPTGESEIVPGEYANVSFAVEVSKDGITETLTLTIPMLIV